MGNLAVANTLGTLGAVCWSVQLLPQIAINALRPSHTEGLQPSMMLLWASAGVPLGVYNIVSNFNIALRIQAQILTLLSLITWSQCCYYEKHWSVQKCLAYLSALAGLMGATEVGLIFALRHSYTAKYREGGKDSESKRVEDWPTTLMAVLAAVLLAAGVLRHYWDIYLHRTVRGISFVFVGIDAAGDLFSLISILFQQELDVLGMTIYGTELSLWIGIFACGGWFNLIPRVKTMITGISGGQELVQEPSQPSALEHAVVLQNLPSSTSVFRTPSSDVVERRVIPSS